jgi:peroxiredoxin
MSFLIGADGRVERIYGRVDPRDHAARVLADVLGI